MKAKVGDCLIVEGTHLGDGRRVGVVLEVQHADGAPPYVVRWLDTGHWCSPAPTPGSRPAPGP
jgi:hypothetical protein